MALFVSRQTELFAEVHRVTDEEILDVVLHLAVEDALVKRAAIGHELIPHAMLTHDTLTAASPGHGIDLIAS